MDDIYFSRFPHAPGRSWGADIDQFFSSPFFTSCGQRLKNHSGISWNGNRIWSVKCLGLSADLGSLVGEGREEGVHVWERKAVRGESTKGVSAPSYCWDSHLCNVAYSKLFIIFYYQVLSIWLVECVVVFENPSVRWCVFKILLGYFCVCFYFSAWWTAWELLRLQSP